MTRHRHRNPDGAPSRTMLAAASRRLRVDVSTALHAMVEDASETRRSTPPAGGEATDPRTRRSRNVQ